ncbi:MAG: universal stress protein [Gemmatimonadales bacterium]
MQFQKIVVGIDYSEASLAAAQWATRKLAPTGQLLLVHVLPEPFAPVYLRMHIAPTLDQLATLTPGLYGALRGFGDVLRDSRVRVGIRTGNPAATLARVAEEVNADMLCVGRGHRRQGGSRFGATTPQRLLAHARIPVLVMPASFDETRTRIVAALDARAGGESVLQIAASLALDWGTGLDAVHVVEAEARRHPLSRYLVRLARQRNKQPLLIDSARRVGIAALGDPDLTLMAEAWLKSGLSAVDEAVRSEAVVRWGDPGPELVAHAQQNAALLVIGRESNRSPLVSAANFPSGSTTRYVVWSAPCPVLVLPPAAAKTTQGLLGRASLRSQAVRHVEGSYAAMSHSLPVRAYGGGAGGDGDSAA